MFDVVVRQRVPPGSLHEWHGIERRIPEADSAVGGYLTCELTDARNGGPDLPATVGMERPVLTEILHDAAEAAGAKIRFETTVATLEQDDAGVDVAFSDGSAGCYDVVIGADRHPVPHYWRHVMWVWGFDDLDKFLAYADGVHLDGVVEQISVPFLIVHGENDRQLPVEYAHRSYEQATVSPKRGLRVFTAAEGGAEHVGLDDLPYVSEYVADWVANTFAEMS